MIDRTACVYVDIIKVLDLFKNLLADNRLNFLETEFLKARAVYVTSKSSPSNFPSERKNIFFMKWKRLVIRTCPFFHALI
jgi:hypothetical protein